MLSRQFDAEVQVASGDRANVRHLHRAQPRRRSCNGGLHMNKFSICEHVNEQKTDAIWL